MEHLQQAILWLIDTYGYVGLFVALALGNMAVPIGTEIVLPVAGALTATGHLSNLGLTIAVALAGELAGSSVRIRDRPLRRRAADRTVWEVRSFHARPIVGGASFLRALGNVRNLRLPFCAGFAGRRSNCGRDCGDESRALLSLDLPRIADLLWSLDSARQRAGPAPKCGASAVASVGVSHPRLRRRCRRSGHRRHAGAVATDSS